VIKMSTQEGVNITPIKRKCESLETEITKAEFLEKAFRNEYVQKRMRESMRENVIASVVPTMGEIQTRVLEAAYDAQIGRQLVWLVDTQEPKVRFPKTVTGRAGRIKDGVPPLLLGSDPTYVDIDANIEIGVRVAYSKSAVEDIIPQIKNQIETESGYAIGVAELVEVKAILDGIAVGNLAGRAAQAPATPNKFAYADVLTLYNALDKENKIKPGSKIICALHPDQLYDSLLSDDKFINANYKTAVELNLPGAIAMDTFGITFIRSTGMTAATVYMLVVDRALGFPLRREVTVDPFTKDLLTGYDATQRFGCSALDTYAVAKMTSC